MEALPGRIEQERRSIGVSTAFGHGYRNGCNMMDDAGIHRVAAYAAAEAGANLVASEVDLPPRISHCGICRSDVDAMDGHYGAMYQYPLVAGHEGVGTVTEVGTAVRHLEPGDRVGVGVFRKFCGACHGCASGQSNLCANKQLTFMLGASGAFAQYVRLRANCAIPIPEVVASEHAGPLMCAGVTTFAPFVTQSIRPGQRVGVAGFGGLGHLAVQWSSKFGCETFCLSRGTARRADAESLGAHHYHDVKEGGWVDRLRGALDFLLVTAAAESLPWLDYLATLAPNGKLVITVDLCLDRIREQLTAGGAGLDDLRGTQACLRPWNTISIARLYTAAFRPVGASPR